MSNVKDFFKEWKPEELKKKERANVLYYKLPDIVAFYMKDGHLGGDDVKRLFDIMEDKKFAKALRLILKTHETDSPVELEFAIIIADFLGSRGAKLEDELLETYTTAINTILRKRNEFVVEKTGLNAVLIQEILTVVPEPDSVPKRLISVYLHKILSKLYGLAREEELELGETKSVRKLMKVIFGKENVEEVAVAVLLEYRDKFARFTDSQKAVWNLFTSFALDTIEKNSKDEIAELLTGFAKRRQKDAKRNKDRARRIQFEAINTEDYPKIHKVYTTLREDSDLREFLV